MSSEFQIPHEMQKTILKATEIMDDKFGIKPSNVELEFHENIREFLKSTDNPCAQSIFIPKNLTAHVPKTKIELVFHEFFGHGLYCEHTKYGKKMVDDEKRYYTMNDRQIEQNLTLHEYFKPDFEGHALWIEDFLLTSLGKSEILSNRLKELRSFDFQSQFFPQLRTHRDVYDRVKQFEEKYGIYELWYILGFPRRFDKQTLLGIVREKLVGRFDDIIFLIRFGSTNSRGDIDLCAVLSDSSKIDEYQHSRTIDLTQFHYSEFLKMLKLFDPQVTEPLLTGNFIFGNNKEFKKLVYKLKNQQPTPDVANYLRRKSNWYLEHADNFFKNFKEGSNALEITLNDLAYALSFHEFAAKYAQGSSILTFSMLNADLLNKVRSYMKLCEDGLEKLQREKVASFISKTTSYIS